VPKTADAARLIQGAQGANRAPLQRLQRSTKTQLPMQNGLSITMAVIGILAINSTPKPRSLRPSLHRRTGRSRRRRARFRWPWTNTR